MSVNDPSTWAPPGESASDLWTEKSNLNGAMLCSIAYGAHTTLYFIVLSHFIRHPTQRKGSAGVAKISWGLVAYITINFILGTLAQAGEMRFTQLMFIDDRNFPGGPNAFNGAEYSDPPGMLTTTSYVILNWFADALVLYRYWLIYSFNIYAAILPCLMLVGSFSMGVLLLFQLMQPNANLWTKTTVNFGIPYWSISASLNILVTLLIVLRLLYVRRRLSKALSSSHTRTYISIATMLVESAALYSTTALIFIITYARNSAVQNLVLPVLGQVQAISPLLIMWRVAMGQAISQDSLPTSSSKFSTYMRQRSGVHDGSKTVVQLKSQTETSSFNLPSFANSQKYTFASDLTGKTMGTDQGDGFELASRSDQKSVGVEVVVERHVDHYDPEKPITRGSAV